MLENIFSIKTQLDFIKLAQFQFSFSPEGNLAELRITADQELGLEDAQKISGIIDSAVDGPTQIGYNIGERSQITLRSAR